MKPVVIIRGRFYDIALDESFRMATSVLQQRVSKPRVIVYERSGIWATVLGLHLPGDVQLVQTRGLDECAQALAAAPLSMVAVELSDDNLCGVLDLLERLPEMFPLARLVILGRLELQRYEPLVREAGAIHFFESPRDLAGFRQTASNHFAQLPPIKADFAESVWAAIPWSDASGA